MTEPVIVLDADVDTPVLQAVPASSPVDLDGEISMGETSGIAPPTKREREAQWIKSAIAAGDLTRASFADLRVMANRMFRLLDADTPPAEAHERYTAITQEIEARMRQRPASGDEARDRAVFKDSAFTSRFELYLDGCLAMYLRYSIANGQVTLRALVEKPGFTGRGLHRVLLRHALLNAHRRRLSVIPACPAVDSFLEQHPQYRTLARLPV